MSKWQLLKKWTFDIQKNMFNITHTKRNANYKYTEIPFLTYQLAKLKKHDDAHAGKAVGKQAFLCTAEW